MSKIHDCNPNLSPMILIGNQLEWYAREIIPYFHSSPFDYTYVLNNANNYLY